MIKTLLKSVVKSVGHGIKNDPEVQRLRQTHPHIFNFIRNRLTPSEKYGLYLTIGGTATLFFIYLFFGILQDYIGQDPLAKADLRIINLISHFRTPGLNHFMLFFTDLARGEVITFAVIFTLTILFLLRKWSYLIGLAISVIGGEIFVWIIKNLVERPRPPLTEALVAEPSYSFPSGHSFIAVAFYGFLTFILFENLKKRWIKTITIIIGTILIILIGVSRIYLGAHWPSDVLASYASSMAWLSIIITTTHIKRKFSPKIIHPPHLQHQTVAKIATGLTVIFFIITSFFYSTHQLKPIITTPVSKTIIQTNQIDTKLFDHLPKISETLTAAPAEPINIIVVGSKENLDKAFTGSGWYILDPISLKTSLKIITAVIKKQSYPQTPGLPVFWDTRTNDFAYGKPTPENLASTRHHIHFWETPYITPDGQPIWVGTAHFDEKIKKKGLFVLPIHTTELIVDNEREDVKNDLEKNHFLKSFEKVNLTGLLYGTKTSGNSFLTDGQAYILYLNN